MKAHPMRQLSALLALGQETGCEHRPRSPRPRCRDGGRAVPRRRCTCLRLSARDACRTIRPCVAHPGPSPLGQFLLDGVSGRPLPRAQGLDSHQPGERANHPRNARTAPRNGRTLAPDSGMVGGSHRQRQAALPHLFVDAPLTCRIGSGIPALVVQAVRVGSLSASGPMRAG